MLIKLWIRHAIRLAALAATVWFGLSNAGEVESKPHLLRPDGQPADWTKPVKVFILMGQSNMVGMGDIRGGSTGWAPALLKPVSTMEVGLSLGWAMADLFRKP